MILINGKSPKITLFPDGTKLIRSEMIAKIDTARITWKYDSDEELFQLQCIVDALRSRGCKSLELIMPYIPNARMDRIKSEDEVFTLKTFANIINNMNFETVTVLDAHSYVSEALLNNVIVQAPTNFIFSAMADISVDRRDIVLFFPDEGAMKRYSPIANELNVPYVFGMKRRDWRTGQILGLDVLGQTELLPGKSVLIVDDICSKGGTFFHSAKALKQFDVKDIYLYVSHCENAMREGDMIKSGLIKRVYTTDSIYRKVDAWQYKDENATATLPVVKTIKEADVLTIFSY